MTVPPQNTLIVGVGNPFRCDDGAGLAVVRRLRGELPPGVQILEETGDGAELLLAWKGVDHVILVDAVQSGAPAGAIHRLDARTQKLPTWFSHWSTHSFGVAEAIELARTMGELPDQLIVFGIEGLEFLAGTELSQEVMEVVPAAANLILKEIPPLSGAPSA